MIYNPKDDNSGNNVYATVILKNYTWSGAVTVANVLLLTNNSFSKINGHFFMLVMDLKTPKQLMCQFKIMTYNWNQKTNQNFLNQIQKTHLNLLNQKKLKAKKDRMDKNNKQIQMINDLQL